MGEESTWRRGFADARAAILAGRRVADRAGDGGGRAAVPVVWRVGSGARGLSFPPGRYATRHGKVSSLAALQKPGDRLRRETCAVCDGKAHTAEVMLLHAHQFSDGGYHVCLYGP